MNQFFIFCSLLISITSNASSITGYVFMDRNNNGLRDKNEEGIKDVSVSDLLVVVKTNEDGFYRCNTSPDSKFIIISMPNGFSTKSWWQKISSDEASLNFPMTTTSINSNFTFIHASDTHVSEKSLDRMQKLQLIIKATKPNFVIVTGDLVKDALRVSEVEATGYFELYMNELQKFSVPVWNIPGNHENFGIERHLSMVSKSHPLYGKKMYHHYLGPNYYSFNVSIWG